MRSLLLVVASFAVGLLVALSIVSVVSQQSFVSRTLLAGHEVAEDAAADEHHHHHEHEAMEEEHEEEEHDMDASALSMTTTTLDSSDFQETDDDDDKWEVGCSFISHNELEATVRFVVCGGGSKKACPRDFPAPLIEESDDQNEIGLPEDGGFGLNVWAVVVNKAGRVCAVATSGPKFDSAWTYARVMAAAKASTANGFSTDKLALASGNLYAMSAAGGAMFGITDSVPVDAHGVNSGSVDSWGESCQRTHRADRDPLCGRRTGGVFPVGGGLALYNKHGKKVGAIGVAGDCPCTDHIVAWKVRFLLEFDYVNAGVGTACLGHQEQDLTDSCAEDAFVDNLVLDGNTNNPGKSVVEKVVALGNDAFTHPVCDDVSSRVIGIQADSQLPHFRRIIHADDDDDDQQGLLEGN